MRALARAGLFATAVMGGTIAWAQQGSPAIEITSEQVKPGITVLYGLGGNIGVSHGPDGSLMIDDQVANLSADIQEAVGALGAGPARFVINTHWHWDHAQGNENFGKAGAIIVAHENVRPRLAEGGTVLGVPSEPAPPEALPLVTYAQGLSFHFNDDTIDLIYTGGGHTDGDSIVRWREANVVHMGDLFMFNQGWPFVDVESGGDVDNLIASLNHAIALMDDQTVVIPGHGQLATRADVMAFRDTVGAAAERIRALKASGMSMEEAVAERPVTGMLSTATSFVGDDAFVERVWASLEAQDN